MVLNSPVHTLLTNLRETEALLAAAVPHRVPVLLTSTSEVYGKSQQPAFGEEDDLLIGPPHQTRWGYACSKLMDEFLALACARERSLPVVVARLFNTVGPRQTGRYGMWCRASSPPPGAASPSRSMATAPRHAASAWLPTRSRRWCACKGVQRPAARSSTWAARKKSPSGIWPSW